VDRRGGRIIDDALAGTSPVAPGIRWRHKRGRRNRTRLDAARIFRTTRFARCGDTSLTRFVDAGLA
jgi:hypothetical protein